MAEELTAEVVWKGKLKFEGRSSFDQAIRLDVSPPLGDNEGTKPMELLLVSLAGCAGQTIVSLLQKMRQDVRAFSIRARGDEKRRPPARLHLNPPGSWKPPVPASTGPPWKRPFS